MNAMTLTAASDRHKWRIGLRIAVILALAVLQYGGYMICHVNKAFSGPWFPFRWGPSPEYETWRVLVGFLEFPIVTIAHGVGLSDTIFEGIAIILNSLLWASVIYLGFSRLLAATRRHK
jgi:hypothetical protein